MFPLTKLAETWGREIARYGRWAVGSGKITFEGEIPSGPFIAVTWHSMNLLALAVIAERRPHPYRAFVPPGLAGATMRGWLIASGMTPVPLPSDGTGNPIAGLREMGRTLAADWNIAIALDGPHGPPRSLRRFALRSPVHRFVGPGQIDLEGGASAHLTVHPDVAAVLLNDAVDGGEPEARSLAPLFGGEEGFEDMGEDLGVDPGAGVAHGQHDVGSWARAKMRTYVLLSEFYISRLDGQLPSTGHRVAGIDRQVRGDLLYLARIHLHRPQSLLAPQGELHVFAGQLPKEFGSRLHDAAEINHPRLDELSSLESEELPAECLRPIGRNPYLVK